MKVAYLHTAAYHPIHAAYAKAVGADFIRIDKYLPWLQDKKQNRIKQYASMLLNGFFSPARRYDVIITDEVKPEAAIIKLTSFRKKKLVTTQASYTLTKVYENKLSRNNSNILRKIVNYYDALICVGDELYEIAREICKNNPAIIISKIYNGVSDERIEVLSRIEYNAAANTIISIANCFSRDTYNYKGIDIMIGVFDKLLITHPDLNYTIVGNFIPAINDELLSKYSVNTRSRIFFKPFDNNISTYLNTAILYLQLSRYESFGIAVTEAAFAGIPAFISDQVGARIMLSDLPGKDAFVIENENTDQAVSKILAFLLLTPSEKVEVSRQFRTLARPYSEKNAMQNYKDVFKTSVGGH